MTNIRPVASNNPSSISAPRPGVSIGKYTVQDVIGTGGMGRIYRVWDTTLGRPLALKVLQPAAALDEGEVARFRREVATLAKLHHPAIVAAVDAGDYNGAPFYVMELCEGENLEVLSTKKPVEPTAAARLMIQIARGVAHMHGCGIIHRDIKPSNIVVREDGLAVLMDFGLAKGLSRNVNLTQTGVSLGTPAFMSPEQARGDPALVGPGSDVWQLGATLFAAVAGRPPVRGTTPMDMMRALAEGARADYSGVDVPPPLRAILDRAMAPKSLDRYPSANAFADDLERWLAGEWVQARGGSPLLRAVHTVKRYAAPIMISVAATAVVVAVLASTSAGRRIVGGTPETAAETAPVARKLKPIGAVALQNGRFLRLARAADNKDGVIGVIGIEARKDDGKKPGGAGSGATQVPVTDTPDLPVGWGDYEAEFEYQPGAAADAAGTKTGAVPVLMPVICFVGGSLARPDDGVAVVHNIAAGTVSVSDGGRMLVVAPLPVKKSSPPEPVAVGVARRRGFLEITFRVGSDAAPVLRVEARDRVGLRVGAAPAGQIGVRTSGESLAVATVSYRQLSEDTDAVAVLMGRGVWDEALRTLSARVRAAEEAEDREEVSRLELLRGECLLGQIQPSNAADWAGLKAQAEASFERARESSDRTTAFYAWLALLEFRLEANYAATAQADRGRGEFPNHALDNARRLADRQDRRWELLTAMLGVGRKYLPASHAGINSQQEQESVARTARVTLALLRRLGDESYADPHMRTLAIAGQFLALDNAERNAPMFAAEWKATRAALPAPVPADAVPKTGE